MVHVSHGTGGREGALKLLFHEHVLLFLHAAPLFRASVLEPDFHLRNKEKEFIFYISWHINRNPPSHKRYRDLFALAFEITFEVYCNNLR